MHLSSVLPAILLAGCPHRVPDSPPAEPASLLQAGVLALPTGTLQGGQWQDLVFPMSFHVIDDWIVEPGSEATEVGAAPVPLRLVATHLDTGVRMEILAFRGEDQTFQGPWERIGCTWAFHDVGDYGGLRVIGEVEVATCVPDDPADPIVLGSYVTVDDIRWHFEAEIPPGRLVPGRQAIQSFLGGIRFRRD